MRGMVRELPKPEQWRDRPVLTAVAFLFGLTFAGVCAWWGVAGLVRSQYLTALVMLGCAVTVLCGLLGAAIAKLGWVTPCASVDAQGTLLRIDSFVTWLCCAAAVVIIPSGALFVVLVLTGGLDIPVASDRQRGFLAVLMGLAVIGGFGILAAMAKRGGLGHVRLTRTGFEIAALARTSHGLWANVREVSDEAVDKRAQHPVDVEMKNGSNHVVNGAANFTPHGVALYWMVRHYWLHPEDRAELTDGRAVERLRKEDFDVAS